MINENIEICKKCGGRCCIKSGCDYGSIDFPNKKYSYLLDSISKGDKSIVAFLNFKTKKDGQIIIEPLLYVRARNINRDIVDLISMKTTCSQLDENGCKYNYNERPLGGKNLTPSRIEDGPCRPIISPLEIVKSWQPYQNQLRRIVKHYTGMNIENKIRQDVENLFYDILMEKFEGVAEAELIDIRDFAKFLLKVFPKEYENAYIRYKKNKNVLKLEKRK